MAQQHRAGCWHLATSSHPEPHCPRSPLLLCPAPAHRDAGPRDVLGSRSSKPPSTPSPSPSLAAGVTYPGGGSGRAGSSPRPAVGRSPPCSARSGGPPCCPGSRGSGTRSLSPSGGPSRRRTAWTSRCSHRLGRGERHLKQCSELRVPATKPEAHPDTQGSSPGDENLPFLLC